MAMVRGIGIWEGEKPRTTVVRERLWGEDSASDTSVVDLAGDCDSVVVDPERSKGGGAGSESFETGAIWGGAERGPLSLTMDTIIFSKSSELM